MKYQFAKKWIALKYVSNMSSLNGSHLKSAIENTNGAGPPNEILILKKMQNK